MKILLAAKKVVDPYVKIRLQTDGQGVDLNGVKMVMNPFDEIALEEAVRLKEQGHCQEIIVVTIGGLVTQDILRHGLALGADRAILVQEERFLSSLMVAKILASVVLKEKPDLCLLGKQSIDSEHGQVPQLLAGILNWGQATFISSLRVSGERLHIQREVDTGIVALELAMPAVVSVDLRLNIPRYPTLPNIMRAKTKPLAILQSSDLAYNYRQEYKVLAVQAPAPRAKGIMLDDVNALCQIIEQEITA